MNAPGGETGPTFILALLKHLTSWQNSTTFHVRVYDNSRDTAYFELRDFPRDNPRGCVAKTVMLHQLIDDYDGPSLILDFDHVGRPIGIEVLYPSDDADD